MIDPLTIILVLMALMLTAYLFWLGSLEVRMNELKMRRELPGWTPGEVEVSKNSGGVDLAVEQTDIQECVACGGPLPPKKSKYCSEDCSQRAARIYTRGYDAGREYNDGQ